MMYKKYILVFLTTLSVLFFSSLPLYSAVASKKPDNIRLTWSESPKTTQSIGWRTDTTVTIGKIQYSPVGQPFSTLPAPPPEKWHTNIGAINQFSVTLRNLQPGTKYQYRVGDGNNWSETFSFTTEKADADRFEFLVFGDSHEKKPIYQVWQKTVTQAYQQNPSAKFTISVGDLIYSGKDYAQWQAWLTACQDVITYIPSVPVIGDHEPRGVTSKEECQRPEYFTKLFRTPQNGPEKLKGEAYSFDYGFAHIVVLNSQLTYEFADPAEKKAMFQAESAWLDADLAATDKPWKIVVYHDATYNLSPDRSGVLTKTYFAPIFDKHHVDVVFNGHDHAMARSYFIRNEEFVSSATDGTVYFISGRSGDNAKESLSHKVWHPFYYDPQAQTCYLAVTIDQKYLVIQTRLADGTIIDKFEINKEKPELSTPAVPFGAYQEVRFAAFGNLLTFGNPPIQNSTGEWFVDIQALATYLNGKFDPLANVFSYNDDEIRLCLTDDMFLDSTKRMVSLSGLTAVGFYCKYHKSMNLITVERWRD
ncbi:MAG: metallophosphoesterase family protein [Candidatus Marinimicrobia bacterium]|nr:metallophosphoesterase family protein [Candidatus Neomarinimicrobiota bacterium]